MIDECRGETVWVCRGVDPDTGQRCGITRRSGEDAARARGWKIGRLPSGAPDAMCPDCARPDPATLAVLREIERGLRSRGSRR